MKRISLIMLAAIMVSATTNAQTVTGSGTTNNLTKWTCPPPFPCVATSAVTNSILSDNGATVFMGNYLGTPPAAYFMHVYESGASGTHNIGLDVELFNRSSTSPVKSFVSNVQGNFENYGIDAYTAGGTNSYGGNFAARNSTNSNIGVNSLGEAGISSFGGVFVSQNSSNANIGVRGSAISNTTIALTGTGGDFSAQHSRNTNTGVNGAGTGGNISIGVSGTGTGSVESRGGYFRGLSAANNYAVKAEATPNINSLASIGMYASSDPFNSFNPTSASLNNYGIYAFARIIENALNNYGIKSHAIIENTSNTNNYGIHATIEGGLTAPFVPGTPGSAGSYAGYFMDKTTASLPPYTNANGAAFFNGSIIATGPGTISVSDKKFKENIAQVDNALEMISKLSAATYTFKSREAFPSFNFPTGKQYGFIAQELEKAIPELVQDKVNPAQYDKDGKKIADAVTFKGVEYTELIPILTAGIQEQQAMITQRDEKINELEARIKRLENAGSNNGSNTGINTTNGSDDVLFQNTPNPFNGFTEIRYRVAQSYTQGGIMIFDMNGKKIKEIAVQGKEGNVSVSASEMAAGLYLYSLVLDGREIATKRMVVNK